MLTEFVLLGVITFAVIYFWGQRKPKNFPPGPWGLPFVGCLPIIGIHPKRLSNLKHKYGPIIGFDFVGNIRAVAINDYKLVKQVANENIFSGRPKINFMSDRSGGEPEGIVFTEGRKWQEQKRFTMRKLRDFGFGTKSMEAIVHEEANDLIERLKSEVGKPISMQNRFNGAVINALWNIVAGERFRQDDPKVNEIFRLFTQGLSSIDVRTFVSMGIPSSVTKYLPDWVTGISNITGPIAEVNALINPHIKSHMGSHILGQPRDFIDTYIDEIKKTNDPSSSFHVSKTKSLPFAMIDLFMAGGETTITTLTWIFLYLVRHKHVQEKLHAEIDRVTGNSRLPSLADRPDMPYTEAIIHEVQRVRPLFPATMQCALEDTEFHGYSIPKGTIMLLNIYDAQFDPTVWGDPENFRPERFLNKEQTKFIHQEGFLVFSTGKRACPGERLARDELFLFTTALFQTFQVDWDHNGEPPSLEFKSAGITMPLPHKLVLTLRN